MSTNLTGFPGKPDSPAEYFDGSTITYAELEASGFVDWDAPEWRVDWYSEAVRVRLIGKIRARFSNRNIGILPRYQWRRELVRKLNEIAPKYNALYKALEGSSIFDESDVYSKGRNIYSDFPQTQLRGASEDYASTGTDTEAETVQRRPMWDSVKNIKEIQDVDAYVLDELEFAFSSLMVVQIDWT